MRAPDDRPGSPRRLAGAMLAARRGGLGRLGGAAMTEPAGPATPESAPRRRPVAGARDCPCGAWTVGERGVSRWPVGVDGPADPCGGGDDPRGRAGARLPGRRIPAFLRRAMPDAGSVDGAGGRGAGAGVAVAPASRAGHGHRADDRHGGRRRGGLGGRGGAGPAALRRAGHRQGSAAGNARRWPMSSRRRRCSSDSGHCRWPPRCCGPPPSPRWCIRCWRPANARDDLGSSGPTAALSHTLPREPEASVS